MGRKVDGTDSFFRPKRGQSVLKERLGSSPAEFPRAFRVRELAGRQHYRNTMAAPLRALLPQVGSYAHQIAFALSHGQGLKQHQGPCVILVVSGKDLRERRDSSGWSLGTEQLSFPQPNPLALLAATSSRVQVPLCPVVAFWHFVRGETARISYLLCRVSRECPASSPAPPPPR